MSNETLSDPEALAPRDIPTGRSGFVSILGRPNVGKSTLMNAILGQKLSIVTHKPQTTRNRILGVHTVEDTGQIIFVDTPGIHRSKKALNRAMNEAANAAIGSTDLYLFVIEAESAVRRPNEPIWGADVRIAEALAPYAAQTILVLNKVDLVKDKSALLPALHTLGTKYGFAEVFPMSARRRSGVTQLVEVIFSKLPEGPLLYPEDMISDRAERFFAAELVREQILLQTQEEVPYGVAVLVETFEEDPATGRLEIGVVIHVERDSQKGILIGKGGSRLKKIGTASRQSLEAFFEKKVHLNTFVRVAQGWTERVRMLTEFGYHEDDQ